MQRILGFASLIKQNASFKDLLLVFARQTDLCRKSGSIFYVFSYKFFDEKIFEGRVIMTDTNVYKDIAARTAGDIYIGVVGPVRTGKSTFIKNLWKRWFCPI